MLSLYLFLLILGGGMAALSLFGDILDVGGGEADALSDIGGDAALDGAGSWWKVFSLIGLVYGAMGAGGTGTLLHLLWSGERPLLTALLAGATGATSGIFASVLLSYLKRSGSGDAPGETSFEGLAASVTLPIRDDIPGKILVRRGSREYVLRALPFSPASTSMDGWHHVVVVEVNAGIAYVTPVEQELEEKNL